MLFQLLTWFVTIQSVYTRIKPQKLDVRRIGHILTVGKGTVKLLKPYGFSYTIFGTHLDEMSFCEDKVIFVGNLNRPVIAMRTAPLMGPFKRRILNRTYEFLQYRNYDVQLKPNDTVNFYLNVSAIHSFYATVTRSFTVLENGTIKCCFNDDACENNPELFVVRARLSLNRI